jgi:hypothetical protein
MTPLDDLLVDLLASLTIVSPSAPDGSCVAVTSAGLDLPVEARLAGDGRCLATPPRGLTSTGFDPPLGRLALNIERAP